MARNVKASKRGWGYDSVSKTLDVYVDGARVTKKSGEHPLIYTASTAQLYDIGTKLETVDRVFFYCKAGTALNRWQGAGNADAWSLTDEAPNQDAAVGATSIQVVNTTADIDQYKNGWVVIFTGRVQLRRVLSNDASDGTDTRLYLDGGLEEAIAKDTTRVTGYLSIYGNTRHQASQYSSIVAVPNCVVAASSYYWGQTYGVCYGRVISTVPGVTAYDRDIYFGAEGDLYGHIQAESDTGGGYQRAGYLLPKTSSGGGDQLYMLQLAR